LQHRSILHKPPRGSVQITHCIHETNFKISLPHSASHLKYDVNINAATDNRRVLKKARKTWHQKKRGLGPDQSHYNQSRVIVQITHYTSPNYTNHPK